MTTEPSRLCTLPERGTHGLHEFVDPDRHISIGICERASIDPAAQCQAHGPYQLADRHPPIGVAIARTRLRIR